MPPPEHPKPRGFKDLLVNEITLDKPLVTRPAAMPKDEEKKYGRFASNKEWTHDTSITIKASNNSHFYIRERVDSFWISGVDFCRIDSITGFQSRTRKENDTSSSMHGD